MHIVTFRVTNYKSFADSEERHLKSGFNVVVGQNNVGKTALAEALSLNIQAEPHRSTALVPTPSASPNPTSTVELLLWVDSEELNDIIQSEMPGTFYVPGGSVYEQSNIASRFQTLLREGVVVRLSHNSLVDFSSSGTTVSRRTRST